MSGQHSTLSPSDAPRWVVCNCAVAATDGIKDEGGVYSDTGTFAHDVSACRLGNRPDPPVPVGIEFGQQESEYVDVYVNAIRREADGKILLVEQPVDVSEYTTEPGGKGTSDAIIVDLEALELQVRDLKFGEGEIVHAEDNYQLQLYALGAATLVEKLFGVQFKTFKMAIHQPRRDHYSEVTMSRLDLFTNGAMFQKAGARALAMLELKRSGFKLEMDSYNPQPKACRWCEIRTTCEALTQSAVEQVVADFGKLEVGKPGTDMPTVPVDSPFKTPDQLWLVETWLKAHKARIDEALKRWDPAAHAAGWKLVKGDMGDRKWRDEKEAEALAKALRIKGAYKKAFLSAPQMEKIVKKASKWDQFKALITRSDARDTMAPATDKRPAVAPPVKAEDFVDVSKFI